MAVSAGAAKCWADGTRACILSYKNMQWKEGILCSHKFEEVAASRILHCNTKILGREETLPETHYVGMNQAGVVDDFSFHLKVIQNRYATPHALSQVIERCMPHQSASKTLHSL